MINRCRHKDDRLLVEIGLGVDISHDSVPIMTSRMADITVLPIDWLRLSMSCPALMAANAIAPLIGLAEIPLLV